MKFGAALLALALLGACHRPHADQPDPGADSDAQANTAAKTLADLKAADAASQGPAQQVTPVVHHDEGKPGPKVDAAPAEETNTVVENEPQQG